MSGKVNEMHLFHQDYSALITLSENNLLKVFRKYNEVCKQWFYFKLLSQVKISVSKGEISQLSKINTLLSCMRNEVSALNCLAYRSSPNNPLRNVNVIILACRYSQPDILDFILSDKCKILQHCPITVGNNSILPTDIDEYHHNAFYYAIRSGETKLVDILIEKWPDEPPLKNSGKLYEVLSNAYRELKLKNVELPIEMEIFVRNIFFEKDFYHDSQTQEPAQQLKKNITKHHGKTQKADDKFKIHIEKRIELVLSNINTLTKDFAMIDVDETFLVIGKFIAKNIHILKRQLRSTYDKIPWEEIEFCLVIFIMTVTEYNGNHLLQAQILSKEKMLTYLTNFANCLYNTLVIINKTTVTSLQKLPTIKESGKNIRQSCVMRIIKLNPNFQKLYKDYDRLRDEYSLKTMKRYLDIAISTECDAEGRLLITRALQFVGEHLKNTLESPKLSDTTCELLLVSLPENTREIVTDLRNSIAHADSMSKRADIEKRSETFFKRIQEDLKKLSIEIVDVLCQFKIRIVRDELKKLCECRNEEELRDILKLSHFENSEEELSKIPVLSRLKEMETLIKDLSHHFRDQTPNEISLFEKINEEIDKERNRYDKIKIGMVKKLKSYKFFIINSHQYTFEGVKKKARILLKKITAEINFSRFCQILVPLQKIANCITSKFDGKEQDKLMHLHFKAFYSVAFELRKIKLIEEYKCTIKENKRKVRNKPQPKLEENILISEKISQLKKILDIDIFQDFTLFKSNRRHQIVVEMLILDIYSLLDENLSHNHLFLDDEPVTLIGRNMRNKLAHENTLINILSSNALIDLVSNAKKIVKECTSNNRRKIGKKIESDINKLQLQHEQDLLIINFQKELFMALSNGDLKTVKTTLQKGADVKTRNIGHRTALHFASKGTSIETIKLVLEENCEVDAKDANGQSALHVAARHGRSNILEYLIKTTRIFMNQVDKYRKTPLHIAAEHGHLEVVKVLIHLKASTNIQDVYGFTPFHYSIQNNHESIARAFLECEDNVVENDAFGGFTPLHIASKSGHFGLVDYLIRRKANVNAQTDTLYVPLHAAVQEGQLEIAKSLIDKGAKVNARYMDGTTALHMVSATGQKPILRLLLEHETNADDVINIYRRSPLTYAAENGNLEIVKLLLEHNAKVNLEDVNGKTPLHFAAENGHQTIVNLLIKNNAFLEMADHIGFTALHYGACNGYTSIVNLLIERGSRIDYKDICSCTPLNYAVLNGHLDVTKLLIDKKAVVNNTDISKSMALHRCCRAQFLDIAKLLIKSQANMHAPSQEFGITPFHLALGLGSKAMLEVFEEGGANIDDIKTPDFTALHLGTVNGKISFLQHLIDSNCDVNAKSKSGLTALHLAVERSNMSVIEFLVEKGAKLDVRDNDGHTPLYYAMHKNNKKIMKCLIKKGATVEDEGEGEPLASAVMNGYHDMVTILLDKGNFDLNVKLANNDSLLSTSVLYRHRKVAEILLEKGADVNAKSNDTTPLFSAAFFGDIEMVKLLLDEGAKPNITSRKEEVTPLYAAVTEGHTDIVDILLRRGATIVNSTNMSSLQLSVQCSRVEVLKFLLKNNHGDVKELIYDSLSLLHLAATMNNLEIVQCLVTKGANNNATDANGRTPLIMAAERGHTEIVAFLHKCSNEAIVNGELALVLAVKNGHLEVAKYLVDNCVNINSLARDGETFLHIASHSNQKEILLYLLGNGAYYNARKTNRKTPLNMTEDSDIKCALELVKELFIAIKRNKLVSLKDAIKKGAILNSKRKDNATPLHYAAWKGRGDILDALLENGANPNIIGRGKYTPLHYASKSGHFGIVRSLLSHGAIYNDQSHTGKKPIEYSTNKDITDLLSLIDKSFRSVQNGNVDFLENLESLRDPEKIKSVMKSRNNKNKLLATFAVINDFPKIKQLKQIIKVDTDSMYEEATEQRILGKYSESLKLFEDILKRMTEVLGHDHPDTLDIKDKIGEVLLEQHYMDKALKIFEETFKTRKESLGANDVSTLNTKRSLAITQHNFGLKAEALKMLQEVYKQQSTVFGKSNLDVLQTQTEMAIMLEQGNNDEEALAHFRTVYELLTESNGDNNPKSLAIQADIAMLLSKQKKHDEALKELHHLYDIQKRIEGEENPNTLEILRKLAHVYHMNGSCNKALRLYNRYLDLKKSASETDNLSILTTLYSKGNVLFSQQKILESFKVFSQCYAKILKLMGQNHPFTQSARESLENARSQFILRYGEAACYVLEKLENENSSIADSLEEKIQEASDIYLERVKHNTYYSLTRFMSEDWDSDLKVLSNNHFVDFIREMSNFRAIAKGDNLMGTNTLTQFVDKDVFYYMETLKKMRSGIHMKFDETD